MNAEVVQEPVASVNEHGVVIVISEKSSDDSRPRPETNNDVSSPIHTVNGSEIDILKAGPDEIVAGTVHTDSGITVENNNDTESGLDLDLVPGVVKTEHVNASAPDPEPWIYRMPIRDDEIVVCPPQPDLIIESCLPIEEKHEDRISSEEVSRVSMENDDVAPGTNPDSASQPERNHFEVLPKDVVIPECLPSEDDQVEPVTAPQTDLVTDSLQLEDPQESNSENLDSLPPLPDSLPPLTTRLPVENDGLLVITPAMIDPAVGLSPVKDEVEVIQQEAPPPEPYSPPENIKVAVVVAPDITEDKSEVFLPAVSDSWLEAEKSNDSIHTRGESRVKFSDSFEVSESPENTADKKQEAVSVSTTNANHVEVMTPEEEYRLRRTTSMESRDNPFVPDGELSKETDELLKRATVIRDTFVLEDAQQRRDSQNLANDSTLMSVAVEQPVVVQETVVVSTSANQAQATPDKKAKKNKKEKKLKENGKVEDSVSPDANKPGVTGKGGADKPSAASDKTDSAADDVDNKKQKKCCAIM